MAKTEAATHKNYIGGRRVESESGKTYTITNPGQQRHRAGGVSDLR